MDPGGESYLRQEGRGLCIGFYEQACKYPLLDDAIGKMPSIQSVLSSLPLLLGISLLFVLPTTAILCS